VTWKNQESAAHASTQTILQWFYAEAGIAHWDREEENAISLMFHLGQLSTAVKGLETPGWTRPGDFRSQIIGLVNWLAGSGRSGAGELLVPPNAVTVSRTSNLSDFLVDTPNLRLRFPSTDRSSKRCVCKTYPTTTITTANVA
jgi:hypothetical protein